MSKSLRGAASGRMIVRLAAAKPPDAPEQPSRVIRALAEPV
ncbi:MAG TPA: hypothetical protein VFQ25_16695 [Ktedonobacterales bacterium]|nr:hypothetical protein [Ktedonobacterales bacterium]